MSLRVAYVCPGIAPYVLGGMQAVARAHTEGLAAAGVDLHVIHTLFRQPPEATSVPGRQVLLPWPDLGPVGRRLPGHFAREMARFSESVADVVRDVAPEVVYADGPLVDALLRVADRPPTVFHPHGIEPFQTLGRWRDDLRSRSLRPIHRRHAACDVVISQGGRLTEILTGPMGVAPERVRVLPNSVPASALSKGRPVRRGPLRLLFVGRDEPRKGLRVLLDAVSALDDVRLEVIGPPAPSEARSDVVTWVGTVRDRERMLARYDAAHVLVVPSFAEGFPTVVIEAMARGLPVIGSDVGAVAEAVVPGETGWLVPAGSVEALRNAIVEASRLDAASYDALSLRAQEAVRSRFVRERVCEELLKILHSVVQT